MKPAPTPDLTKYRQRPGDELTRHLGAVADYWRRLCSQVSSAVWDDHVAALYFDDEGQVVAVKCRDGVAYTADAKGKSVETNNPQGWMWWCSSNAAATLDNHARWAEHAAASQAKKSTVQPEGEMPERVAVSIQKAKEQAEAVLRERGEA